MKKSFLPIGSVVTLKNSAKRVMIIGRMQTEVKSEKTFDYSACLYPEGIINPNELYLFNNEDINILYFVGFQDPEEFQFRKKITELI